MKPYYQDDYVTIYHGDCRDYLLGTSPLVDLVFADPPLNVGKEYEEYNPDYYKWCRGWIDGCFDLLRDTGSFYNMTIPRHLESIYPIMKRNGVFINEIHWRNVSATHNKRGFWNTYQPILLYGKTDSYKFNTYAQIRKNMERWTEWFTGAKGQMLDYWDDIPFVYAGSIKHKEAILKPNTNQKVHPCQMPLELATRMIMFSTDEGDILVEPFGGLCPLAFVAKKLNRKCISFEVKEKYCEIAAKRCSQGVFNFT